MSPTNVTIVLWYLLLVMIGINNTQAFVQNFLRRKRCLPQQISLASSRQNDTHFFSTNGFSMVGWTVEQAIQYSVRKLEKANVMEPEISVQHLLAASLQLSWQSGFREVASSKFSKQILTADQSEDYTSKLDRRLEHEPLQYILGQWDFLDYTVAIRSPLLCPRPETEELVMKIIAETSSKSAVRILDIGAGTGVIGLSLADKLQHATVEAIDIDPIAVQTSLENADRILASDQQHRYHITLCPAQDFAPDQKFDLVVSNPPYIPQADMATLTDDVLRYENKAALCGGPDGMDVIRTIIEKLPQWCNAGAICWMEVDPTHPVMIEELLHSGLLGVEYVTMSKDMFGKDRFVTLKVL